MGNAVPDSREGSAGQLPEDVKRIAAKAFTDGCKGELFYKLQFASDQRLRLFDFLVETLKIKSQEPVAINKLAAYLYGDAAQDSKPTNSLIRELIQLAVREENDGVKLQDGDAANFSSRACKYLRSGFNNVLAKLGQPDGEEDDRGKRERQEAHRFRQGKFLLAAEFDKELSINILNAAVGDFLPEDVTVEQLYNVLHEAAVARVEDDGSSADDRSGPEIKDLRAKLGALLRTEPK